MGKFRDGGKGTDSPSGSRRRSFVPQHQDTGTGIVSPERRCSEKLTVANTMSKSKNQNSRRDFIKKSVMVTAGAYLGSAGFSAASYAKILGSNDRVRVGVIGFSDRFRLSSIIIRN
jgi:hypothetical protein